MNGSGRFVIRAAGDWTAEGVKLSWSPGSRRIEPQVEQAIGIAWANASARLGDRLFDGPMCRLEDFTATPAQLRISVSRTSYRPFLGTNLTNAGFADRFGGDVMANPIGLSAVLESSDGWLLFGRRSDAVAYHPNRIHPFAGALEPREPLDVFAEIGRELREELALTAGDISALRCMGMVEDRSLRQPELIFHVACARRRDQVEANLDAAEHVGVFAIRNDTIAHSLIADPLLTPVAAASLVLWQRSR